MRELLARLTDPDPEVRRDAYEELSLEMDDATAAAILDLVTTGPSEEVRADAVIALGPIIEECGMDYDDALGLEPDDEFGPPVSRETFAAIVERIRAIYDDEAQPKLLRRRAFEVLVRDLEPWQREAIRKHYRSSDLEWRLTAVFAMGMMTGFEKELVEVVISSEGVLLSEAVRSAGQIGATRAAPRIRELATSEETERDLRCEAILALPHVDPDAFEILDELTAAHDPVIAEAAEEALEELGVMRGGFDLDEE